MVKRLLQTFLVMLVIAGITATSLAQVKNLTIPQVQQVSLDSLRALDTLQNNTIGKYKDKSLNWHYSDATGADTVAVTGVVMVKTGVITYTLQRNNLWIQDTTTGQLWGGIEILSSDSTAPGASGTGINAIDTGMIVTITGRVTEFGGNNSITEMFIYNTAAPVYTNPPPISIGGILPSRPLAKEITLDSLTSIDTPKPSRGEKYESMYVIIRNVTVATVDASSGAFTFQDANGNIGHEYDGSGWYTLRGHKITGSKYAPYPVGTKLSYIRGIITVQSRTGTCGDYTITPLYPGKDQYASSTYVGDIAVAAGGFAPAVSLIKRFPTPPGPSDVDTVTWKAKNLNLGGLIDSSFFNYKMGLGSPWLRTKVAPIGGGGDSLYRATIPAANGDSLVSYYVEAYGGGNYGVFPNPTTPYFYQVRAAGLAIKDIQFTPYVNGISGFNGDTVTVSGTIYADTTDIKDKSYSSRPGLWMASTSGPWNGIYIWGSAANVGLDTLVRGDSIQVRGVVSETFSRTNIKVLSRSVLARGVTPPASTLINFDNIQPYRFTDYQLNNPPVKGNVTFEQFEGTLVRTPSPVYLFYMNADNLTSTAGSNFGEFFISTSKAGTTSTPFGMRVDDNGCNSFFADTTTGSVPQGYLGSGGRWFTDHTDPGQTKKTNLIQVGWTIAGLTAIMDYSFSWYKLEPRKNSDFGTITSVYQVIDEMPKTYTLGQNYPNPFNPSTTISYSIPQASHVSLKVFNLLGQEVENLMDHVQNAGSYKLVFDASRLSTGVYFYQLKTDNYISVKKMLLLK